MNTSQQISSVCVYCGSRNKIARQYTDAARAVGHRLADDGLTLIYGGGRVGLMGIVADAVLERGGTVVGVIPHFLDRLEVAHTGVTELIRTETMQERKTIMATRADAFLALPGGFGTLEELFEILTWRQLQLHDKPVAVLNVDGYWDHLLALLRIQAQEGFLQEEHLALLSVAESVDDAFAALRASAPARYALQDKWL